VRHLPNPRIGQLRRDHGDLSTHSFALPALTDRTGPPGDVSALDLSADELALLVYFRDLKDDETRRACLDALEDFLIYGSP
jgi:hypothetical protein